MLGLLAGYLAAIVYTKPFSAVIEQHFQLQGLAALITAAIVLFLGAYMVINLLIGLIKKLFFGNRGRSAGSAFAGAVVGLFIGTIVSIAIVWTYAFIRDTQSDSVAQNTENDKTSVIEQITSRAVGKAMSSAMTLTDTPPQLAQLSVALAESPADLTGQVQRLSQSQELQTLLQDPANQAVLDSGDIDAVRQLPAFQQLLGNPDMQALAISAGIADPSAAGSPRAETQLATQISDIWRRFQRVKEHPQVQDIFNDPEFRQNIQSGNPLTLLSDARLLQLSDIVFSDDTAPDKPVANPAVEPPAKPSKIYQWIDEKGQVHFSNQRAEPSSD
jgi:hypothetical protein